MSRAIGPADQLSIEDDALTLEELELAVKVFGTLAKWKREALAKKSDQGSEKPPLTDDSNWNEIDNNNEDMAK